MKNILFLFIFAFSSSLVSAQTCTKAKNASDKASCAKTCASKKSASLEKTASLTKVASAVMTADLAAEADETIEKRVCSKSGAESYYQSYTCSESGKTTHKEVMYDTDTQTFVDVRSAMKESTPVKLAPVEAEKKAVDGKDGKVKSAVKTATAKQCAKTCASKKKAAVEQ